MSSSWYAGFTAQYSTAVMYVRGVGNGQLDGWLPSYFGGDFPADTWRQVMDRVMDGEEPIELAEPAYVDGEAPDDGHAPYTPPPPPPTKTKSEEPTTEITRTPTATARPTTRTPAPTTRTSRARPTRTATVRSMSRTRTATESRTTRTRAPTTQTSPARPTTTATASSTEPGNDTDGDGVVDPLDPCPEQPRHS